MALQARQLAVAGYVDMATTGLNKRGYSFMPTPDTLASIDFADKSTNSGMLRLVGILSLALVAPVVITRLMVRATITRQLFLDDCKWRRRGR